MNASDFVIEFEGITKIYQKGPQEVYALDEVDMIVQEGELLAVVGPSGSGKSTLLNILSLLVRPTRGRYVLNSRDVSDLNDEDASEIRNRDIGFVFQSFNLFPQLTARENIEVPMQYAGVPSEQRKERAGKLAEMVGLGDRVRHQPTELSGGERQRVAIARALSNRPSILLADEPTGNLDDETASGIVDTLIRFNEEENITIILVTHDLELADIGTRILRLRDGQIEHQSNGGS